MKHKLFRVLISTYYFGNRNYYIYVLADNFDEALEYTRNSPEYSKDEDAKIKEIVEIAFETKGVINIF